MDPLPRLRNLFEELQRRRVFRVAVCYSAVAYVVVEVANNFFPPLQLPEWTTTLVAALAVLGFPVAVALAWAFEVTPQGVRRADAPPAEEPPQAPRAEAAGSKIAGSKIASFEGDAPDRGPARQRRPSLVHAAGVAVLVLTGGWLARSAVDGPGETDAATVAVLPFTVAGSADFAYLASGIVDLLGRNLDGSPDLRALDAAAVLRAAGEEAELDPEGGLRVARELGAGAFVIGTIHETAGRLRIHASLYENQRTERPAAQASAEGEPERLFELVDRLSAELMAHRRSGAVSHRLAQSAAVTTGSLEAFHAYLEAERAFRVADMPTAVAGYQRAIAADSGFALAYYRLASAYWWSDPRPGVDRLQLYELSRDAAERAAALSDRLGERDRRLVEAFAALHRGEADRAEERYRAFLEDYPDDIEVRFQLADLLHHYNAPRGRPLAEAGDQFRRVLAGDPEFACPI